MATATIKKRRIAKKRRASSSVQLFGIELVADGWVRAGGRTYDDGKGFLAECGSGVIAWKPPFLRCVYFRLSTGRILALLYRDAQRRWREASAYLLPKELDAAVPTFSFQRFLRDLCKDDDRIAYWQPCPGEYVLSQSLRFLTGGRIQFKDRNGGTVTTDVATLPLDRTPVEVAGLDGPHYLRRVGASRFNLETPGIRHTERFLVSDDGHTFYRHCYAQQLASNDLDAWGIRYLDDAELLIANAPIPFRLKAEGKPWRIDLPYGSVRYEHGGFLVLKNPENKFAERYFSEESGWNEITSGMWEVNPTWVLAEKQLSVTVSDVLELFSDGSCTFLKQYSSPLGVPIDAAGPSGLRLVRAAGDEWLSLFEGDELLGMGYFEWSVFHEKDGTSHPSWAWGCEVDLPGGTRGYSLDYFIGGILVVGAVLFVLAPELTVTALSYIVIWGVTIVAFLKLQVVLFGLIDTYLLPYFRAVGSVAMRALRAALKLIPGI